jgi:hypothetical protein
MKAILEFNLPDDQPEFNDSINGGKWSHAMWQMDQWLRSQTKYAPDTMSTDTYEAFEECREKLHSLLNEQSLQFK